MSLLALKHLFEPRSIAVIGASNRPERAGHVIMRNLLEGGFSGPIMPVNPKYHAVAGVLNYSDIESLPETPDLAIVATRMSAVPLIIAKLNARGARAAVVFASDPDELDGSGQTRFRKALLDAAGSHGLRILGTGSLGLLVPHAGLNASLSPVKAHPGKIAFVSQSGALCTAVLDWARPKGIGFSHFISLGECLDIGFGDILDVLGADPDVHAILLYIESLGERRTFVAAARAAARNKPVLVVKAGEKATGCGEQNRPATLTQAMVTRDDAYDAVIRRAGMLRVYDTDELFAAVETLARVRRIKGDRLAVLANGGGLSVMAIDALRQAEGRLAALSEAARHGFDEALGRAWSGTNPIDLQADVPAERYAAALEVLLNDAEVDATLVLHSPTALSSATDSARAVIASAARRGGVIMTSWLGGEKVAPARQMFADAGLPTYDTPGRAVRAFGHLVQYHRNQEVLLQTPASDPVEFAPRIAEARAAVDRALAESGGVLSGPTARAVLAAYDIPITKSRFVRTPEEARAAAVELGFPCALTVVSPDVLHKWEVGGVALQLRSDEAVEAAARSMISQVTQAVPGARIRGFSLQPVITLPHARQLIIGVTTDPLFGPVIVFGQGGRSAEVLRDHAVGLPPLNMPLAAELVSHTRIKNLLAAHYGRPAVDIEAVYLTLVKVSQLIVDIPEISALDINPLLANEQGVVAVDAEIRANAEARSDTHRLSIQPYPKFWEEPAQLRDGRTLLLRPIRPEDEEKQQVLLSRLTPEDIRFRFFSYITQLPHLEMARLTQIDYDREMAFIAVAPVPGGSSESLGVVRTITDPDNQTAEFSIVVRSDLKRQGLGRILLEKMVRYCRTRGTGAIVGQVLAENAAMIQLTKSLGFATRRGPDPEIVEVSLALNPPAPGPTERDAGRRP